MNPDMFFFNSSLNKYNVYEVSLKIKYINPALFLVIFCYFSTVSIYSQSINIEKGVNGAGIEIFNAIDQGNFKTIGLKGGFSISGIMDFGLKANYSFYELNNEDINELNAAIYLDAFLLKQTDSFPLSFQLTFSYGLTNVEDEDNNIDNDINKDKYFGHGFTMGAGFYRDLIFKKFNISLGILTEYRSYLFITRPLRFTDDSVSTFEFIEERKYDLEYGAEVGVVLTFIKNVIPYVRTRFLLDRDFHFKVLPILGVSRSFE